MPHICDCLLVYLELQRDPVSSRASLGPTAAFGGQADSLCSIGVLSRLTPSRHSLPAPGGAEGACDPFADHHQNFEVLIRRRGRFGRARSRRSKDVAQSARVWLTELVGRGNSEAIASRSLFAFDLQLGAFQYRDGA
jgi:hypothetical protein